MAEETRYSGVVSSPRRLGVRSPNWLGDAVMSFPAVQRLHEAYPDSELVIVTRAHLAGLWTRVPGVSKVVSLDRESGLLASARKIRQEGLDAYLLFPSSMRTALEGWIGGAKRRIGYGSYVRRRLLTQVVPKTEAYRQMHKRSKAEIRLLRQAFSLGDRSSDAVKTRPYLLENHHVHHYLRLAASLGANERPMVPALEHSEGECWRVFERLVGERTEGSLLIGLNAGAEYGPAKRWPLERYGEVAGLLEAKQSVRWLLFGGPGDVERCESLRGLLVSTGCQRVVTVAGKTSLIEASMLFRLMDVVITNDTGPMHLAAASGTRVVAIFGSTSPELTGPGLPGESARVKVVAADIPCRPCFRRECPVGLECLTSVSAQRVAREVREFIEKGPASKGVE